MITKLGGRKFESTTELPNSVSGPKILALPPTTTIAKLWEVNRAHTNT